MLSIRETHVVARSNLDSCVDFVHPENIRVSVSSVRRRPLDIGSFAFSKRSKSDSGQGRAVDLKSIVPSRRALVRAILDKIYIYGRSERTLITDFWNYKSAIDWCDAEGFTDTFCSPSRARESYWRYTEYLRGKVLTEKSLGPSSVMGMQSGLRELIRMQFPSECEYILSGVQTLNFPRAVPEPPRESDVNKYLDICLRIALQYSEFVLAGAKFPFRFELDGHNAYIFADSRWLIGPFTKNTNPPVSYNFEKGRICTLDEFLKRSQGSSLAAETSLGLVQKFQDQCNSDLRCLSRLRLASAAMYAFASLLCVATAANASDFVQFKYRDAVKLTESYFRNDFKAIKGRARGSETAYTLGRKSGLALLRKYLKLREWILNGQECDPLFFLPLVSGYPPLSASFMSDFFKKKLRGRYLPLDAVNITSAAARKNKSLVLRQLDVLNKAVASSLNNSEGVSFKSYNSTTLEAQSREFDEFWASVRAAKVSFNENERDSTSTATGHCDAFKNPEALIVGTAVAPNCETQYGCLFCSHYLCHADDEDVHKLLSLQYVVDVVRRFSPNASHAERLFLELSIRISAVIKAVENKSEAHSALVDSVRNKVHHLGLLTPFWERRLSRYERLGIVQ